MEQRIKPLKRLGQNFLTDKRAVAKIIQGANILNTDIVLEIGPGTGILTKELAQKAKKVIAVEKDRRMIDLLKEELKDFKNVEIIQGDILKDKIKIKDYKIVANLPFYITAPTIRKFLEEKNQPKNMTLIIQKEVAQRICAKPPKTNILAISVQFYADPKIISYISKRSFSPTPKVDAAIIQITPKEKHKINPDEFFKLVKTGFSHPRKQLKNNLKDLIDPPPLPLKLRRARAENLSTDDWIKLVKML